MRSCERSVRTSHVRPRPYRRHSAVVPELDHPVGERLGGVDDVAVHAVDDRGAARADPGRDHGETMGHRVDDLDLLAGAGEQRADRERARPIELVEIVDRPRSTIPSSACHGTNVAPGRIERERGLMLSHEGQDVAGEPQQALQVERVRSRRRRRRCRRRCSQWYGSTAIGT